MRGKLIVLDGNDGSGKQTQTEWLANTLRAMSRRVVTFSFPRYNGSFFGELIDRLRHGEYGDFSKNEPHLTSIAYALDRAQCREVILHALNGGDYVICDRYVSANQIHQGGKIEDGHKRREFLVWLDRMEHEDLGVVRPDVTVYLDVPPAVSRELMSDKTRDELEKNPLYLENSHKAAQWLIKHHHDRMIHVTCTKDGVMRTREDIHEDVVSALRRRRFLP